LEEPDAARIGLHLFGAHATRGVGDFRHRAGSRKRAHDELNLLQAHARAPDEARVFHLRRVAADRVPSPRHDHPA
jgi:hypothetical protein